MFVGGECDIGKFISVGLGIFFVFFEENSVIGRGIVIYGFFN